MANATSMCISSPILLIVLVTMAEDGVFHVSESLATVFGCVFLLGMVAAAVFLFITYGMRESHMEHFEKECFETEYGVSGMVREKKDSYEPIFIRGTAVGVVLCILAVIPTIIAGAMGTSDYCCGLSVTLLMQIYSCAKEGAQFIIVTHSPILLGIPDADIYCFDNGRIHLCEYEDTESYQVTEMFINNRQMLLDRLLTD